MQGAETRDCSVAAEELGRFLFPSVRIRLRHVELEMRTHSSSHFRTRYPGKKNHELKKDLLP